jgi:DNA-binding response OmpR family regulator
MPPAAESTLPPRVLIVDDEQEIRDRAVGLLKAAGYETQVATDGAQALTLFARDWYPVVITDRDMPVLDGIELVAKLRAIALAPVYVVMLTTSNDVQDHERGYCAGVDQSIAKQNYETELVPKVKAGMTAVKRRRASATGRSNEPVTVDLENGAHTARHLVGRLHAEIAQVPRTSGALHVLSVGLESNEAGAGSKRRTDGPSSATLLTAVYSTIRPKQDWVARLPAPPNTCRLAIVMPESDLNDIAAVEQGIRNALVHYGTESALRGIELSVGVARLAADDNPPTALELLGQSERNRRSKEVPAAGVGKVQAEEAPTPAPDQKA